jgi:hypothetical protein
VGEWTGRNISLVLPPIIPPIAAADSVPSVSRYMQGDPDEPVIHKQQMNMLSRANVAVNSYSEEWGHKIRLSFGLDINFTLNLRKIIKYGCRVKHFEFQLA